MTDIPTPTEEEIVDLEKAVRANDCDCGRTVRVVEDRCGLNRTTTTRCTVHEALEHDVMLRARLIAMRRDQMRLWVEEYMPMNEGY